MGTSGFQFLRMDEYRECGRIGCQNGKLPGFENGAKIPRIYVVKAGQNFGTMVPDTLIARGFTAKKKLVKKFYADLHNWLRFQSSDFHRHKIPEVRKKAKKVLSWDKDEM